MSQQTESRSLSVSSILLSVPLAMATLRFTVYENPSVLSSRTQSSPEFWLSDYEKSNQRCLNVLVAHFVPSFQRLPSWFAFVKSALDFEKETEGGKRGPYLSFTWSESSLLSCEHLSRLQAYYVSTKGNFRYWNSNFFLLIVFNRL